MEIPTTKRRKWHEEARELFRPTKNGYNDALSHLLLIDTLMRVSPAQIIRAANLRDLLATECPQVAWDSVTVGRIMTELSELTRSHRKNGDEQYLQTGRDRFGAYFTLDHSAATYRFLSDLRDEASQQMRDELSLVQKGLEPPTRSFSVWDSFSTKQYKAAGVIALVLLPALGHLADAVLNAIGMAA